MPDRDYYRDSYRDPQSRSDRGSRDERDQRRSESGWSSASEGGSFADRDAGAPYGDRSGRDDRGGGGQSVARYGGQGAYGQGPGPGSYGYGEGVTGWNQDRSDNRVGQMDLDYDRGGQGGYGRNGVDPRGGEWSSSGRRAHAEGRYDERGGRHAWDRDSGQRRLGREDHNPSEPALHRVTDGDEHEHSYRRWRDRQLEAHDRDYAQWRGQQAKRYDDDYGQWRNQRHEAFSKDFETWRSGRGGQAEAGAPGQTSVTATPEVENVTDGRKPGDDRTD